MNELVCKFRYAPSVFLFLCYFVNTAGYQRKLRSWIGTQQAVRATMNKFEFIPCELWV